MSPLPDKRKSAEEIAELRKSLGITGDGPPADAPGVPGRPPGAAPAPMPSPPAEVPEPTAADPTPALPARKEATEPVAEPPSKSEATPEPDRGSSEPVADKAEPEPVPKLQAGHSLRKSASLVVDQPKAMASRDSGKLPSRRHSERELMQLRKTEVPNVTPPVVQLEKLSAHGAVLLCLYGAGFLGLGLTFAGLKAASMAPIDLPFDGLAELVGEPWYPMLLFGILAGGGGVMLLGAGWIQWRKKRSSHHAAILTILAVLVLVFGTLYFFPQLHGA